MKIGLNIAAGLLRGSIHDRIGKAFTLGAWFALCTYVSSGILPMIDMLLPGDLPDGLAPAIGGAITVLVVVLKGL